MGCRLGWDFCILAVIRRWLLCSGGCLLRFHCKGFEGRGSNYRFGKPHQLAIDGTMPGNFSGGISGFPIIYEFLYEAPATLYSLQDLRFKREALSAMEAFKDMTVNNDGWVIEKNEVSE